MGNHYYPTIVIGQNLATLIDAGSRTPAEAGLYHYTTRVDQTKEGSKTSGLQADLGFHYVAAGVNGQPIDSNADGLPDYLQDRNGNGVYDTGDLGDFNSSDTDGDGMPNAWEVEHGLNPLDGTDASNDPDGDLLSNYEEYVWNTDPLEAHTMSAVKNDGEFHLTAVTGQSGTRVSVTVTVASYNPAIDTTDLEFIVAGALFDEFHGLYLYNSGGQFWKNLFARYIDTVTAGDRYRATPSRNSS